MKPISTTTPSTPPPEQHPEKVFQDARTLLAAVRSTLADLLAQVRDGEAGALGELAFKQAELETALRRAFEAERKYHDWQARNARDGVARPGEIDLVALRHEIRCRLARLRECCQDG